MKIAVTSQDFLRVTGHAGMARRFLLYQTDASGKAQLVERLDLPSSMAFHGFEGGQHPIDGVEVLITGSAGEGLVAKMAARDIRVVRTAQMNPDQAVRELLLGQVTPPAESSSHHGGCACSCGGHDHEGHH